MTLTLIPAITIENGQLREIALDAVVQDLRASDISGVYAAGSNTDENRKLLEYLQEAGIVLGEVNFGVRTPQDFEQILSIGAQRVVVGTHCNILEPWITEILKARSELISIELAIQIIDGEPTISESAVGGAPIDLWELLEHLDNSGCSRIIAHIVADSERAENDVLRGIAAATDSDVVFYGDLTITELDELKELSEAEYIDERIASAIIEIAGADTNTVHAENAQEGLGFFRALQML